MTKTSLTYLRVLRPTQWVKNFFLFAPLVFSRHLFEEGYALAAVQAFVVFCLISSGAYIINDIGDRELDRSHPVKRRRPVASGEVTISAALVMAAGLVIVGVLLGKGLPVKFQLMAVLYLAMNVAYSFWLKRVMLVDVFVIAAGFMLRVLAGAFAIDVVVSHWLVLCTLFVSLFLATSKRRGELVLSERAEGYVGRSVLRHYHVGVIDQIMTVTAAGMAISYALYTVAERTVTMYGTENLIFTTVFVLFGIFRYFFLVRREETEDNPVRLLLRDGVMLVNILAWFLACLVIIHLADIRELMR